MRLNKEKVHELAKAFRKKGLRFILFYIPCLVFTYLMFTKGLLAFLPAVGMALLIYLVTYFLICFAMLYVDRWRDRKQKRTYRPAGNDTPVSGPVCPRKPFPWNGTPEEKEAYYEYLRASGVLEPPAVVERHSCDKRNSDLKYDLVSAISLAFAILFALLLLMLTDTRPPAVLGYIGMISCGLAVIGFIAFWYYEKCEESRAKKLRTRHIRNGLDWRE